MNKSILAICTVLFLSAFTTACVGQGGKAIPIANPGTLLRKIQDRGRLIVGVKYDVPTFGYMNPQTKQLEGFDVDLAREIADVIFGDKSKLEFKEAVTATRIANVQNGTFDLILATMVISEDRLKDVDFSIVYYQSGGRLLVPKESPIKSVTDLDGNTKVGTSKGSVYVDRLGKLSKAQVLQYDTQAAAADEMLARHLDAVAANDIILYGLALQDPRLKVVGSQFTTEYLGAAVAKGNPDLLKAVNAAINQVKTTGTWKTLWKSDVGDKFGMSTVPEPPSDDWRVGN
jgi:aspartate/glutamate/glutamine transport system substrate-binding protein